MSKKKTILRIIIVALLVCLMFIAGYTYSKYMSSVSGRVSANIAKWSFSASGENGVSLNDISLINTADNMATANNTIAPGTSGSFGIVIDATGSEVGVDYSVTVSNENSGQSHLQFYLDDGSQNPTKYNSLTALANAELKGTIAANDANKVITLPVAWEWPYEGTGTDLEKKMYDVGDLNIAETISSYSFGLTITGKQVAPTN